MAAAGLGAVVLSGTVDGMAGAERGQLLGAIGTRLAPGGTLVVHSVTRQAWEAADAPPEADLAAGRPLRPEAWCTPAGAERVRGRGAARPGRPRLPRHRGPGRHHLAVRARGAVSAAAGGPVAVHQFIATLNPHDATGTHALQLRDALRAAGWRSEIFAEAIHDDLAAEAFKHWMYPEHAAPGDVAIYQFTTSSAVAGYLAEHGLPLILDFHNFTGPGVLRRLGAARACERAAAAADELALLAPAALLGLAKSPFSEQELRRAGCRRTAVVPVLADYRRVTAGPGRAGGGGAGPPAGGRRRRHPVRRADRAVQGPARAGQGAVGLPPALRRRRPACTWWAARRASSTPRPCRTSWTTSACPPRSACRARCRTRRWPPTSRPPTSTSRCRRTRGSGSRSSRRWWPACPSSPGAPGRCPTPWPTPRWCWPPPTPPTSRRPCTGSAPTSGCAPR